MRCTDAERSGAERGRLVVRSPQDSSIQVFGQIAVRRAGHDPRVLTGATRVLLAILVAAGPEGATLDLTANAYWPDHRPSSWQVGLRASASRLTALLPDGWAVSIDDEVLRLVPGDGYVDAWRLEAEHNSPATAAARPAWIASGKPFAGVDGIELVDRAAARLDAIMQAPALQPPAALDPFSAELPLSAQHIDTLQSWVVDTRRAIVLASPERGAALARAALADAETETSVVVGDQRLLLPLGPFGVTFPELRNQMDLKRGTADPETTLRGFRTVTDAIARRDFDHPQRLFIANAHELDHSSRALTSLLIERAPLSDFSMIICADSACRDLRWLDFLRRSATAGCDLIEAD